MVPIIRHRPSKVLGLGGGRVLAAGPKRVQWRPDPDKGGSNTLVTIVLTCVVVVLLFLTMARTAPQAMGLAVAGQNSGTPPVSLNLGRGLFRSPGTPERMAVSTAPAVATTTASTEAAAQAVLPPLKKNNIAELLARSEAQLAKSEAALKASIAQTIQTRFMSEGEREEQARHSDPRLSQLEALEAELTDAVCHSYEHTELWGEVVYSGAKITVNSAEKCCKECTRHADHVAEGVSDSKLPCNVWVWCGDHDKCGDMYGQCWLKNQANPRYPAIREDHADVMWTSGTLYEEPDPSILLNAGQVVINSDEGDIIIQLRPDLSPKICDAVTQIAKRKACSGCKFYRAERMWDVPYGPPYALLQGSLSNWLKDEDGTPVLTTMQREGAPILQRGYVALIGEGPDFFISLTEHVEWGYGHTVWGEVLNMDVVDKITRLPTKSRIWGTTQVTELIDHIPFELEQAPDERSLESFLH